jgi:hypothetical protein
LFPHDDLHSREATSLRDTPLSPDAVPPSPPAPPSKGDLISSAGPRSLSDDAVDLGLVPPKETIFRWEAGPPRASATGSASADAPWKSKKRSPQVFRGDAALKELWSRLAAAPTDQTPQLPLAPEKTRIFASTARLRVVALAAGSALGLLWASPANQTAGTEAVQVLMREAPRPAAQNVAVERAPGPSAAAEHAAAARAALYQDFLKWRQLQLRGR